MRLDFLRWWWANDRIGLTLSVLSIALSLTAITIALVFAS